MTEGSVELALATRDVLRELSQQVIGCAIEVHRELGPGLLESVYSHCLARELCRAGLDVQHDVGIPVVYKSELIDCGFRADLIVNRSMLIELKAVERIIPLYEAQLLTYLKLCNLRLGLIINFNAAPLKNGIRRLVR